MAETAAPVPPLRTSLPLAVVPYLAFIVAEVIVAVLLRPTRQEDLLFDPGWAVGSLAAYAVLILVAWRIARAVDPTRALLGLRRAPIGRSARLIGILFIIGMGASVGLEPIFHAGREQGIAPPPFPGGAAAATGLALSAIVVVVVGPLAEELYFRGLLLGILQPVGSTLAIGVAALTFALSHFELAAIPVIVILGVVLGVARVRSRSLWPAVAIHVLNNAVALAYALG